MWGSVIVLVLVLVIEIRGSVNALNRPFSLKSCNTYTAKTTRALVLSEKPPRGWPIARYSGVWVFDSTALVQAGYIKRQSDGRCVCLKFKGTKFCHSQHLRLQSGVLWGYHVPEKSGIKIYALGNVRDGVTLEMVSSVELNTYLEYDTEDGIVFYRYNIYMWYLCRHPPLT